MVEQLIVLGNGFDLASGLKSTYWNFIEHVFRINNTTFEKVADVVSKFSIDNTTRSFMLGLSDEIPAELHLNIWYLLLVHSKISNDSNWVDVEKQLYKYVANDFVGNILQVSQGISPASGSKEISSFANVVYKQFSEINQVEDFSKESITDLLMSRLNQLECDFNDFLFKAGYSAPFASGSDYLKLSEQLMEQLLREGDYYPPYNILTFNYTEPWQWQDYSGGRYWAKELIPNQISMVHGQATNFSRERRTSHIIFGIDHSNFTPVQLEYRFTKTYRTLIMQSNRDYLTQNVFDKNIKVIKFYGHSLGEADYSYFQQMFDFYDLYHNNDLKLIFYYNKYGNRTEELVLQEQVTAITRLIEKYGETMNNKDHGKNLLTRLQQTKRIFVREMIY